MSPLSSKSRRSISVVRPARVTCTCRALPRGVMPPVVRMISCSRCVASTCRVPGRSTSPETTTSNERGEITAMLTSA